MWWVGCLKVQIVSGCPLANSPQHARGPRDNMTTVRCPHCNTRLKFPDEVGHRRLRCGSCGQRIPDVGGETEPPAASSVRCTRVGAEAASRSVGSAGTRSRFRPDVSPPPLVLATFGLLSCMLVVVVVLTWVARPASTTTVATLENRARVALASRPEPEATAVKPESEPAPLVFAVAPPAPPEAPQHALPMELRNESPVKSIADVLKSVCVVQTEDGIGTGFVVKERSLIATNFHVIEGAKKAHVEFPNGATIDVSGFLIASPGYDLAVLRLASDAPAAPLKLRAGESDVGVDVFAVGNPQGLAGSVSKGVISARRRWEDLRPLLRDHLHDFGYELDGSWVQTDAAINGGNSGGPLCLADGTVIAINTLGVPAEIGQNLNFAIDASHLMHFLNRLPAKPRSLAAMPPSPAGKQPARTEPESANAVRIPSEAETRRHGVPLVEKYMTSLAAEVKTGRYTANNSPRFALLSRKFLSQHDVDPANFSLYDYPFNEFKIEMVRGSKVFVRGSTGLWSKTIVFFVVVEDGAFLINPEKVLRKSDGYISDGVSAAITIREE